jgi:two-component system sensor histidine kinase KdpD
MSAIPPRGALPAGFTGLGSRRRWGGAALLAVGLGALVAARGPVRGLPYELPLLLALVLVVAASLVGGSWVALPGAVVAALVLNWFFTPPFGTLLVDRPEQVVVLAVFLGVAVAVGAVVGLAARRTAEAARARAEAEALSRLAGATMAEQRTLTDLLASVREVFGMREAALLERSADGWSVAETSAGRAPEPGEHERRVPAGPGLELVVRGRELFAADREVLASFAEAAAGALHGRRLAERAAEAARLEAADRMRTTLLAGVGHDLRTPLSAIKAAVSSLRQDDVVWTPEEAAELLATIEAGADRLQHLVGNLLDASRLQAGVVSTSLERVRLEELVGRALLDLGSLDLLDLDVPEDLPDVLADVGLGERVLVNLLENAFRHGGGRVTVRGTQLGNRVACDVVDTGPGVPAEAREQLFVPFARLEGDRGGTGLGLGLSVARGFAEAMGGELTPVGTPGGGLTMRLTLPLAETPARTAAP